MVQFIFLTTRSPLSGRSRGAIISQYYNRTMQLRRRRQSRPSIRDFSHSARPSIRGYGMEADCIDAEASKRERLVNNLQNLSVSDRIRMLRAMPLSLAEKSELRYMQNSLSLHLHKFIAVRQCWYSWLSFLHSLQLWQVALKRVSGRFGTGVLSYFLFLKTLLFFNLFLFLVTGAFLVLPQAVHPPVLSADRQSFSGLELLTGAGYFSDTVMYYGYYCNYTLHRSCRDDDGGQNISVSTGTTSSCLSSHHSYNMPLAYFFIIGAAFFFTCIILVYSMSKSFGQSFRIDKSHSILAMKVFCSWDFKVIKKTSVKLMSEKICTQLKFSPTYLPLSLTLLQQQQALTNKHPMLKEASLLALPALVSLINLLLPGLFNLAAWMEDYESPSVGTYVCWENFVGQELYRFLLMDFIFILLDTLFGEFLWRFFSEKVLKRRRKPVFDIARNVLELIYGQTLAWLGVLFTPLLPAVQILKLLLLFYIKKSSVMMNCQAPRKPYRVSQMTTIFITLLCFPSFLGASVCVTYTMWSITPSTSCGPFRGLKTMFQAGKRWVEQLERDNPNLSVLARAHAYLVENPLFLFVGAGIFLIVIYFHSQVVDGQRKIISLLQEQIENEGEDKKFLITRLQHIHEQKRTSKRRLKSQVSL
uniref:Transmembrane channel-like protein n=1 Tax=Mastacembelus armatus TaxID=205130 RepID=A0A7N8Y3M9_9TELE